MANFVYNEIKRALANKEIDLDTDDIRLAIVMTNTTADTEDDKNDFSGFTTLDEYDGANYVNKALASLVINEDAANNRAEIDCADVVWTALGAGTRQAQALILYKAVSGGAGATAANRIPIAFIDTGGFPFTGNGGDITVVINAEGILQIT